MHDTPRGVSSSLAMCSIARILGAPVTEPDAKRALTPEPIVHPPTNSPLTIEVICQKDG